MGSSFKGSSDGPIQVTNPLDPTLNSRLASAPIKPARSGFLGTGKSGDDIMNAILQAAAIAQGDYTGAASIGQATKKTDPNAKFNEWQRQFDYEQAHKTPEPDEFTRHMVAAGIDPNSEQGKALYYGHVQSMGDPTVATSLPGDRFYSGPRSGLAQALRAYAATQPSAGPVPRVSDEASYNAIPPGAQYMTPDGQIRVKGGGADNSTGGFPGRGY